MKILFLSFLSSIFVIFFILSPSLTSALTTFGKTNSNSNQNPPPPPTPVMVEVVTTISRPSVAFEIARLTSMGRSGGRPGGSLHTAHSGHSSSGKAKDCKADSDCLVIQNTTCKIDPQDQKTRCLCSDYSAPDNGKCDSKYKAVGAACSDHQECGEGAECVTGNNTSQGKKCQCMEGYFEENNKCNGASSIFNNSSMALMALAMVALRNMNFF